MRCYFNLESETSRILDEDGIEVADLADARVQALNAAAELSDEEADVQQWEGWELRVVDPAGNLLLCLPLGPFASTVPQGHSPARFAPSPELPQERADMLQNLRACSAAGSAH